MDLSRRQFLQLSTGAGAGTAVGTLVGLGVNLAPAATRAQHLRIQDAKVTPSVCPYCSVGCATLVHTIDDKIVNIEGDPRSPHNEGTLCPKGTAIYQSSVPGLGTRLGRGAATMYPRNLEFADCLVIEGSNMAECHPVAFRWPMQAKANGAKLIHVDPRFTRTSAMTALHAPIRAGTDIAFLGGLRCSLRHSGSR